MRQQEAKLVMCERILSRPQELAPDLLGCRLRESCRHELVPGIWRYTATGTHAPGQDVQKQQCASYLPSPEIARCCATPDVRSKAGTGSRYLPGDLYYL